MFIPRSTLASEWLTTGKTEACIVFTVTNAIVFPILLEMLVPFRFKMNISRIAWTTISITKSFDGITQKMHLSHTFSNEIFVDQTECLNFKNCTFQPAGTKIAPPGPMSSTFLDWAVCDELEMLGHTRSHLKH